MRLGRARDAALSVAAAAALRTLVGSAVPLRIAGSFLTACALRGDGVFRDRDVDIRVPRAAGEFTTEHALQHAFAVCRALNATASTRPDSDPQPPCDSEAAAASGASGACASDQCQWAWVPVASAHFPCAHVLQDVAALPVAVPPSASAEEAQAATASAPGLVGTGSRPPAAAVPVRSAACPWQCAPCHNRNVFFAGKRDGGSLRVVFLVLVPLPPDCAVPTDLASAGRLFTRVRDTLLPLAVSWPLREPEAATDSAALRLQLVFSQFIKLDYSLSRQWDEQPLAAHNSLSAGWEWLPVAGGGGPGPGPPNAGSGAVLCVAPASPGALAAVTPPPPPPGQGPPGAASQWVLVVRSSLMDKPMYRHARDGYFQGGADQVWCWGLGSPALQIWIFWFLFLP